MAKSIVACTLSFCVAFFFSTVAAQQYAGDVINNTLPYFPGSELVYFRIKDPAGLNNNLTLINYYSLQANGVRVVPSQIQRAIIIVHGLDRDPSTYMANMVSAIQQITTDPNINMSSVAIMCPYFPNGDDKNVGYPWTNGLPAGYGSTTNALVWQASYWASGQNNQYPHKSQTVSSFEVLDQLVEFFDNTTIFPRMKQIVVGGHSLGAQTVNRYAEVGNVITTKSPVTYYIANPNSYAWMSTSRPIPTTGCPSYDNWREGFNNYTVYPMSYGNTLVTSGGRAAILALYNSRSKAYARGTQDLGDDSTTCAPFSTGANRNERFFNFINYFPAACSAPGKGQCDTIDYVNAGHDAGVMFASNAGLARLFTDNFYGNGSVAYDFGYPRIQAGDDPYPNPAWNGTVSGPKTVYAGNMTYAGCWTDTSTTVRSLKYLAYQNSSNTIELCTAACIRLGYTVAGMEFATQCWCASALAYTATLTIDSGCTLVCPGNSSEICGDQNRLSVYSNGTALQNAIPGTPEVVGNYNAYQCVTEASSGRALSALTYTDATNMTLENCAAFCNGYQYFGTEFGTQCCCGSYFNAGSTVALNSDCSMTCVGSVGELCGGPSRLNTYQLSSGASVSVISQPPPGATSAGSSGTSSIPLASQCPTTNGQILTDAKNVSYTIYCSSDTSTDSYASLGASNSYLDCMTACDAASGTGCAGFTYVGGNYGVGSGTCYLKSGNIGSITSAASNLVAGVLSGGSGTVNVNSSSSTSASVAIPTAYCPSTDGKTIFDNTGQPYTVHCSSDSSIGSYSSASAASSYLDCMTACDTNSATGCIGAVYVGGANGLGSGTCYLKSSMGTYSTAGNNLVAIVQNPSILLSSTTSSTSTSSIQNSSTTSLSSSNSSTFAGSSTAPYANSTSAVSSTTPYKNSTSASTTSSSPLYSSSVSAFASPTAVGHNTAVACPANNNTIYTASNGETFLIECGIDHQAGDLSSTSASSLSGCIEACAQSAACVDVSLLGVGCYMKSSVGVASYGNANIFGAKLVNMSASSSTMTSTSSPSITSSSSSSFFSNTTSSSSSSAPSSLPNTTSSLVSTNNTSSTVASTLSTTTRPFSTSSSSGTSGVVFSSTTVSSTNSSVQSSSTTQSSTYNMSGSQNLSTSTLYGTSTMSSSQNSSISTSPSSASTSISSSTSSTMNTTSSTSSILPPGFSSLGCYTDGSPRSLSYQQPDATSNNTGAGCAQLCASKGYRYSGTEYFEECWCDNYIGTSGVNASTSSCNTPCSGDKTQMCGGPNRLSLVINNNWQQSFFARSSYLTWNVMSCYVDSTSSRTLATGLSVAGGGSNMTTANCLNACQKAGKTYCGTEYAEECWGSTTMPLSSLALSGDPLTQGCTMPCSANSTKSCGGSNRVLVFINNGTSS